MRILLLTLLITSFSFGQISVSDVEESKTIGSIGGMGTTFIELQKSGDLYTIVYKDEKFAHLNEYKSFSFSSDDSETLYDLLLQGINEKKKQTKRVELKNDILMLEFKKSFGKGVVEIYHNPEKNPEITGKVQWMDSKRLNKLFGK